MESRQLLASVSGIVWNDADKSHTLDESESPQGNAVVFIDANRNGRLDTGERRAATGNDGSYTINNLAAGTYDVTAIAPRGQGQTTPGYTGAVQHHFNIGLSYLSSLTAAQTRAFETAARRWEAIIVGDLPDVQTDAGLVDDVLIDVSVFDIDGPSGTLAQGDATSKRQTTFLPSRGLITFDQADIDDLADDGKLIETITHEMAHVLGFGTIWEDKGLLSGVGTSSPRFTGTRATAAYKTLFNVNATGIPVESDGGEGTDLSHWRESTFTVEQMTGFTEDAGVIEPISLVTIQQFADLGYTVNLAAADSFNPKTRAASRWKPSDAGVGVFTRRVSLTTNEDQDAVDFGHRVNKAPSITRLSTSSNSVLRGESIVLTATVSDPNRDEILGVTFYRESNGKSGLQTGSDSFIGTRVTPRRGLFKMTTGTADLAPGTTTYYATTTDEFLAADQERTTAEVVSRPTRPNPLIVTPQGSTMTLLQWKDRSTNETAFRIEVSTQSSFAGSAVFRRLNVAANVRSATIIGLRAGITYFYRIRAFNDIGGSAWTTSGGVVQSV
ncbi:MAG: carboxypeptidase regulatory-like domain-containing protein [Burkholderiales bacterium]|nr:carboxypeptidase regulatory-like domain-containing protein [Phycisphaerae bacterium]